VEALLLLHLSSLRYFHDETDAALGHCDKAAELLAELDNPLWEAVAFHGKGNFLVHQGRYIEAVSAGERSLELLDDSRITPIEVAESERVTARVVLGLAYAYLNDFDKSFAFLFMALDSVTHSFDRGFALETLGFAYLRAGRSDDAVRVYREAVECRREIGHEWGEAGALGELGSALRASGDVECARQAWQQALAIMDDIGHPNAETIRAQLSGLDADQN
jgi:tetratricopeptide (TPR) repeat protein